MKIARILGIVLVLGAGFAAGWLLKDRWSGGQSAQGGRKVLYWVDPMHPAYKSDKPGIAPDCGMKLEPVYADGGGPETAAAPKGKILYYRDPQNHDYKADTPGLNPETGNELEPVYENDPANFPVGTVQISPEKQQLIGVQFGTAELGTTTSKFRAVGKVTYDETRLAHVHTKFEGWIGQVFVDFTGKAVKKGEPLFTIYSPELLATQRELLLAGRARDVLRKASNPETVANSDSLFEAARRRLELWDLSDAQIDEVLKTGKPIKNVTFYSPIEGYVLERKAFPNQKVMPDEPLFTVADLSRVWIMADVFEYEASNVRLGQSARVTPSYGEGKSFIARVSYIQPQVDPMTRTLKVRLEADNPGLVLKPDMFVDVDFRMNNPQRLTVPVEAVLDAGERQTVFVDRGNGYFEPRQVKTGERQGNRIEILSGLKAGERIVTSGNFLIDSESQLKAAAAGMGGMAGHQHGAGGMAEGESKKPAQAGVKEGQAAPQTPSAPAEGGHKHD